MLKHINKFLFVLLLSGTAIADDMTAIRHLEPRQTKVVMFDVPKGKSHITVDSDTAGATFDCSMSKEDGQSYVKTDTNVCEFFIDFDIDHNLKLRITNKTIKPVECRAAFHKFK
jgi:hypothetical protein